MLLLTLLFTTPIFASQKEVRRLEHEVARLRDQVELLGFKNKGLHSELEQRKEAEQKNRKNKKRLEATLKELEAKIKSLQAEQANYQAERKELLNKIEISAQEIDTLKSLKLENESHLQTISALNSRLSELGHILQGQQNELKELNSTLASKMLKHPQELSAKERIEHDRQEREQVRALAGHYWEGARAPASQTSPSWQQIISQWAQQNSSDFRFDPINNSILILAGRSHLFKKASSELEERTQRLLKRLDLFIKGPLSQDLSKFAKIELIGHASPSYRGRPIEPRFAPKKAQAFNQKLSLKRANSARNFLSQLSPKLPMIASGAGFYNPIERTPATAKEDSCGKYDCALSRRLEVKFHLK